MRIITGIHRGRTLDAPKDNSIRPTSDRTREAVFNMLLHGAFVQDGASSPLIDQPVADLCCGTGAMGLEALSRGAKSVTFVDHAQDALMLARHNAQKLRETARCHFVRADVTALPRAAFACSLMFLDPPYNTDVGEKALVSAAARGWLAPGAIVMLEQSIKYQVPVPAGFALLDTRHYGNAQVLVLRYEGGGFNCA